VRGRLRWLLWSWGDVGRSQGPDAGSDGKRARRWLRAEGTKGRAEPLRVTTMGVSVLMPLAYDWPLAGRAIRSVYGIADEVIIGIDSDRVSFAGRPFAFDCDEFSASLERWDPDSKVRVVRDNFHRHPHAMDNETATRNRLLELARPSNWIVSLDADERLLNAEMLPAFLSKCSPERVVLAEWLFCWKVIGETALVVTPPDAIRFAFRPCAGRRFTYGRKVSGPQVVAPCPLLHWGYGGRSQAGDGHGGLDTSDRSELERKFEHWGHAHDVHPGLYLKFWDSVDLTNYEDVRDFHPLHGPLWKRLEARPLVDLQFHEERGAAA
jgi:hypothetical protein